MIEVKANGSRSKYKKAKKQNYDTMCKIQEIVNFCTMSSVDEIDQELAQQNMEVINELIENDDAMSVHEENLSNAKDQHAKLVKKLKQQCLSTISISELLEHVLENFDDTGEYLGFENVHLQLIHDRLAQESESIQKTLEKMLFPP